ncbi:hypothetical protein JCM5353_003499 [Sporobolomyces roseus]
MTGTRGKRVKLSPTTQSPSLHPLSNIDPSLPVSDHHSYSRTSPSAFQLDHSPNVSPQPQPGNSTGGGGGGGGAQGSGSGSASSDRAAERKERNRLAAQRSRDKRAAEFQQVAQECEALKAENEELKIRLEEKDAELGEKDRMIKILQGIIETGQHGASAGGGGGSGGGNTAVNGIGGLSDLVNASNFLASTNDVSSSTSSSISSMQF